MKKNIYLLIVLSLLLVVSCVRPGTTQLIINENNLPEELKGLKIYRVSLVNGEYVNIALINNQVNSTNYTVDKRINSTILMGSYALKKAFIEELGNDSIIIRKK
jgi:hypothetical protein